MAWIVYFVHYLFAKIVRNPTTAGPLPSQRKQLMEFAKDIRKLVDHYISDTDKLCFKASIRRVPRLAALGFTNHTAAFRFIRAISDATGTLIL